MVGIVSVLFTKQNEADIGANFTAAMGFVRRVVRDIKNDGRVKIGFSGLLITPLSAEKRRK